MAVVGPADCGKTELVFKMSSGNTFYPKTNHILFSYPEMQQIYIKMEQKNWCYFEKFANIQILNNLANCLMIIDDSCDENITAKSLLSWPLQDVTKILMLFTQRTIFISSASGLVQYI